MQPDDGNGRGAPREQAQQTPDAFFNTERDAQQVEIGTPEAQRAHYIGAVGTTTNTASVERRMAPLEPVTPEFAVLIETEPLEV